MYSITAMDQYSPASVTVPANMLFVEISEFPDNGTSIVANKEYTITVSAISDQGTSYPSDPVVVSELSWVFMHYICTYVYTMNKLENGLLFAKFAKFSTPKFSHAQSLVLKECLIAIWYRVNTIDYIHAYLHNYVYIASNVYQLEFTSDIHGDYSPIFYAPIGLD